MSSSLTAAYRRYFPLLVHKCTRMLGDSHEAQDVAQESFVRLHRSGLCDRDPRLVTAWLYRTSTHLAIDRLRARKRQRTRADVSALDALPASDATDARTVAREAWTVLACEVPQLELEVALLSRVDGLTQDEVAEVTSLHPRRIRRLLVRFDAHLARIRQRGESWTV